MQRIYFTLTCIILGVMGLGVAQTLAQKTPLTHEVYDDWKSLGKRGISDNGVFAFYQIEPQEGDGDLYVRNVQKQQEITKIARGFDATFAHPDFLVGKIKPPFKATRAAKIKKKKPDEMPKDALFFLNLNTNQRNEIAAVRSYKTPKYPNGWVAYLLDTSTFISPKMGGKKDVALAKIADSIIKKSIREVKGKITEDKLIKIAEEAAKKIHKYSYDGLGDDDGDVEGDDAKKASKGYDLQLENLNTQFKKTFQRIADYQFDENGNTLLMKQVKVNKDTTTQNMVLLYDLKSDRTDTLKRNFHEAKKFASTPNGDQWAFVAEVDSSTKALQKFYKLFYYKNGQDSAQLIADRFSEQIDKNHIINDLSDIAFSKDGSKLFFGVSPIRIPKDTTLVAFETAKLDIWHYNDDELQPQQLINIKSNLAKSNLVVYHTDSKNFVQLTHEDEGLETQLVNEGNAHWVFGETTKGHRISANWVGKSQKTAYSIDVNTGAKSLIQRDIFANFSPSPAGKYVVWYDIKQKTYSAYELASKQTHIISNGISQPIYDTENDIPDDPRAMGIAGWIQNDSSIWIVTVKDLWEVPLAHPSMAKNRTQQNTSAERWAFEVLQTQPDQRFFSNSDTLVFTAQNKTTKEWGLYWYDMNSRNLEHVSTEPMHPMRVDKAKNASAYLIQKANIQASDLYMGSHPRALENVTHLASQHEKYNWLSSELVRWKMFDGKMSEGILYKPENFDPNKKYPMLFYFYEKNSDNLYDYKMPSPSASTINIPYFVSNGYLVFDPNIYYKDGEPGESAYNSVVSAAEFFAKKPYVDAQNMAIQGQSWGGYQVAYLVTRTSMFKAAGTGAPVSNMTSAYGGIRWGSGIVREFQYEKQQSRIGASLWERQDLYLKNSPLFHLPKVNTPLLIMHNDQDGAVPWYQGIELFTGLRRLGKKAWLLQYNGEDHNLKERRNKKDLAIRLAQFFDYYLKGAAPAKWITEGVPAVNKGLDWGLSIDKN